MCSWCRLEGSEVTTCEPTDGFEGILTKEVVIRKGTAERCSLNRTRNLRVQCGEDSARTADEGGASVNDGVLVGSCEGDGLVTDKDGSHRDHPVLGLSQGDEVDVASVQG